MKYTLTVDLRLTDPGAGDLSPTAAEEYHFTADNNEEAVDIAKGLLSADDVFGERVLNG